MSMKRIRQVPLREDYFALTQDTYSAIILQQLVYWSERVEDFDKFIDEEIERSKETGATISIPKRHGWIYKSAQDLKEECMLDCSPDTIRRRMLKLIENGYIEERVNPSDPFDRVRQYRVNLLKIALDLAELGYPMPGYRVDLSAEIEAASAAAEPTDADSNPQNAALNPQNAARNPQNAAPEPHGAAAIHRDYNRDYNRDY